MLTVAYCRVSTEEQAEEGFSIEGQIDRLRAYAAMRDLGEISVITDPGLSGKDTNRPGLQRLLEAVSDGHVSNVVVWRLDRLSRNLGDLIKLADTFGQANVALHSVAESLDLSSASGRMFYNILGTFAQYFREHLSENVIMGNARAVREGKWINRPKTGYDLIEGELVPNAQAAFIREVFHLRAAKQSLRTIADQTGLNYSTVDSILKSRIYLGEVLHNGEWFPGHHEAIISEEEWRAAQRSLGRGVQPNRDILTGRVKCGLCGRRMALQQNGKGGTFYKCWHRGVGCDQGARSTKGLGRAAVKGLHLFGHDEELRAAVRRRLSGRSGGSPVRGTRGRPASPATALKSLTDKRRKLLDLYFAGAISSDGFREAERELIAAIEAATGRADREAQEIRTHEDLKTRFEQVAAILQNLEIEALWSQATDEERRILVEELVESVVVFPDHFEIHVHGAPPLTVLPGEVGMKGSQIVGVGDPTKQFCNLPLATANRWPISQIILFFI